MFFSPSAHYSDPTNEYQKYLTYLHYKTHKSFVYIL
ncbi:hypothetical protein NGUA18_04195 [Salmonella enterica]|nr:hypothetical protein NGUA18_04195 [Salmonella enterica]